MSDLQEQFDAFCLRIVECGKSILYVSGFEQQINSFELDLVNFTYRNNLNVNLEPVMTDFLIAYDGIVTNWTMRPEKASLSVLLNPAKRSVFQENHGEFLYYLEVGLSYKLAGETIVLKKEFELVK